MAVAALSSLPHAHARKGSTVMPAPQTHAHLTENSVRVLNASKTSACSVVEITVFVVVSENRTDTSAVP